MAVEPYLRPTVTQRMRDFLGRGAAPPPWSTFDELQDRVSAEMLRRRSDPTFWEEAAALVERIRADALRDPSAGLPTAQAEILSRREIVGVVAELRDALREVPAASGPGTMRRLLAGRSAAALAWVSLLVAGIGAGCKKSPSEGGAATGSG